MNNTALGRFGDPVLVSKSFIFNSRIKGPNKKYNNNNNSLFKIS